MLVNQTGRKSKTEIFNTQVTELNGHHVDPTMIVMEVTFAPTTCGHTTDNLNPLEGAGSSPSAQEPVLTTCSMAERFNGGVTPTQLTLLMVWTPLMDWRDLKPLIGEISKPVALTTLDALASNSVPGSSGMELKMVNLMPMDPLATFKMKVDAQVNPTGEPSMPITGALMVLASVLTLNKIVLQLPKVPTLFLLVSPSLS